MNADGGSWAPFGPSGEDAARPSEPPPADEPPIAFAPPSPPVVAWPEPAPPPISTWTGPAPAPYGTPRRTAGKATASLVLALVGLVLCPLIASAAAIWLGHSARREIRRRPEELTGGSQAAWGIALGWVGVALGVVLILLITAATPV